MPARHALAVALLGVTFAAAAQPEPTTAAGFLERGRQSYAKKEYDKAIKDYDAAIKLGPKHAPTFSARGNLRGRLGDYDAAIADLDEAIRLDPAVADAFNSRGMCRKFKGEYARAIDDFTEAVRLSPKDPMAYRNRTLVRAACPDPKFRDGTQAVADAKAACDLTGWKDSFFLEAYTAACAEAGDFAEAVKWQKKVLEDARYAKRFGDGVRERLKLYEAGKPYRDEPARNRPPA